MKQITATFLALIFTSYSVAQDHKRELLTSLYDLSLEELLEVKVVSTTRTDLAKREAPGTVISFNAREIDQMGFRSIYDLLDTVSGVQTYDAGVGRQRAWFRGSQSEFNSKIALFIDNVPIRDFRGGFSMDLALPIDSVKRLEIIRGPGSSLYGTNAFSGVINIYTHEPGDKNGRTQTKWQAGNKETYRGFISHDYHSENVGVLLDLQSLATDGIENRRDRNGFSLGGTESPQQLSAGRLKLSFLDKKLMFNGAWSRFRHDTPYKGINRIKDTEDIRSELSVNFKDNIDNDTSIDILGFYTEHKFRDVETTNTFWQNSNQVSALETETAKEDIDLLGAKIYVDWEHIQNNNILIGSEWSLERISTNSNDIVNSSFDINGNITSGPAPTSAPWVGERISQHSFAIYVQDYFRFNDNKTSLTTGVRYDWLDEFDAEYSYRVGLVHQFSNLWFGKLLHGTAFRAPSLLEFTRLDAGESPPQPEQIKTTEIQLGYQKESDLLVTLTGFYNNYSDYIERDNSNSMIGGNENFRNTGDRVMYGWELEATTVPAHGLELYSNLAYLRTKDRELDTELPFLAEFTYSAGFRYKSRFKIGSIVTNVYMNGTDARSNFGAPISVQPSAGARPSSFSDGYAILNTGIKYQADKEEGIVLGFNIYNLTDKEYYDRTLPTEGLRGVYADGAYNLWDSQSPERTYVFTFMSTF